MSVGAMRSPEQGQLVSVRSRRWVVSDVNKSGLTPRPLEPVSEKAQHLVSLLSVEDDALGEELQVVWEIEPGVQVIEKVALPEPTGFDSPDRLDAFLDAVRWGAASTADLRNIQAPGFAPAEQEQFERNVDALKRRLEEIPGEIKKETEAIRARFADPQPRMFPVAVTFLVPRGMARV